MSSRRAGAALCPARPLVPWCPRAKLRLQAFLEAISKTQTCADMHAHPPNTCRTVYRGGPLYLLIFLEYLFMCRLHEEEKRTYYRSESLYTACSPLEALSVEKLQAAKTR